MSWKFEHNVLTELEIGGKNAILPWGIETADSSSFFSLEDGVGYRYQLEDFSHVIHESGANTSLISKMKQGRWKLECTDQIATRSVLRTAILTCLDDSVFMDYVMRFRFKKEHFHSATINGQTYTHKNTNIYNQHPVDHVSLDGITKLTVRIRDKKCPDSFVPMMYVRDRGDEWIVHARMIPRNGTFDVIKMCNRYMGTRPLPQWITKLLLIIPSIKEKLWYRGERSPYRNKVMRVLNPCAFSMVRLQKGETLKWDVEVSWN